MISSTICLLGAEMTLRLKNARMDNYDVEMWRYSNKLKNKVSDPVLDFDHQLNKEAILQNVRIRINNWGLRGKKIQLSNKDVRRILFLGGSITLGWGVEEEDTMTAQLGKMFLENGYEVEVLNAGIGNYNTKRYVSRFLNRLSDLRPNDIVVHYFLRDAEELKPAKANILLKNSQLALTLWLAYNRTFRSTGEESIIDHYRKVYDVRSAGYIDMRNNLKRLAEYSKKEGINIYLLMTPDIHNLKDYKFSYIHKQIKEIAVKQGYIFIDSLPKFIGRDSRTLFAMPGDPHPNKIGHKLMAELIFKALIRE